MKWTSYLIYGYREIQAGVVALVQRGILRFDSAVFAVVDDGSEATVVGLASTVSALPKPAAPVNQVLQNYAATTPSWGADIRHGTSPAGSGAIRLTDGDDIQGAGAHVFNADSALELQVGGTANVALTTSGTELAKGHRYGRTIEDTDDPYQILPTDRVVVYSVANGSVQFYATPATGSYVEIINTSGTQIDLIRNGNDVNGDPYDQFLESGYRAWIFFDGTQWHAHRAPITTANPPV